jgi:hypothetical protein
MSIQYYLKTEEIETVQPALSIIIVSRPNSRVIRYYQQDLIT